MALPSELYAMSTRAADKSHTGTPRGPVGCRLCLQLAHFARVVGSALTMAPLDHHISWIFAFEGCNIEQAAHVER